MATEVEERALQALLQSLEWGGLPKISGAFGQSFSNTMLYDTANELRAAAVALAKERGFKRLDDLGKVVDYEVEE